MLLVTLTKVMNLYFFVIQFDFYMNLLVLKIVYRNIAMKQW
ncbi:hypothetical protein LV85_04358 [Algoriphagus chordae]|uniref:Uncharacterized protein n=1 Tax=Algoriphagus chordae TaxID=237019 RepID=A0A2W7QR54_9BACT|nr:hypothetical protein LV85_04358 [Algoriphagus chordae]